MGKPKSSKPSEWFRLFRVRCDLCRRLAVWAHPEGGRRCEKCPRPESKRKVPHV